MSAAVTQLLHVCNKPATSSRFRSVGSRFMSSATRVRAIGYSKHGEPSQVLTAISGEPLPSPKAGQLKIKFLLSTINPADMDIIWGRYPAVPIPRHDLGVGAEASSEGGDPYFVPGNEAVAEVLQVGETDRYKKGDWVLMRKPQIGTWTNQQLVNEDDVFRLPAGKTLTEVQAATLAINPATALGMLTSFKPLERGEFIVQNGANSAVGQAVIQIAASMGVKTINFVRNRPDLDKLKERLKSLGATHVATYDDLENTKEFRKTVKEWTGGAPIGLGLNCVGGMEVNRMASLFGPNAHLVSYGAMSRAPISLPTSLFIFKNLTAHGYWQTRWYKKATIDERINLVEKLAKLVQSGQLREPDHEVVTLGGSDEHILSQIRGVLDGFKQGRSGKKILLRFGEE